jgi:hypothetical protein
MKGIQMRSKAQLWREADSLEASAKDNLRSWTILGQTSKYDEHMQKAANLRRAAELKGRERAEYMQNHGLA